MGPRICWGTAFLFAHFCCISAHSLAAEEFISAPPSRSARSRLKPAAAIAKMTVPPGFSVELVAAEPDIVNPTAMAIDDRGRFWICESLEYPRREPALDETESRSSKTLTATATQTRQRSLSRG